MSIDDPSLLQDFLTESVELIEALDVDLVKLESASSPDEAQELCNSCFRALHTIKGAASFLGLDAVTKFSHVAEDALNKLRKGEIAVTEYVMDALLQSADVVRGQIEQLIAGEESSEGPQALVDMLHAISEGKLEGDESATPKLVEDAETQTCQADTSVNEADLPGEPLQLGPEKLDLLEFMIADLKEQADQVTAEADKLTNDATREETALHLVEVVDGLVKTTDYCELDPLLKTLRAAHAILGHIDQLDANTIAHVAVRLSALMTLCQEQATAMEQQRVLTWPMETLTERLAQAAKGEAIEDAPPLDVHAALVMDGVIKTSETQEAQETKETQAPVKDVETQTKPEATKAAPAASKATAVEQTIRVEVRRLESLLNLVGQLVLNKNRVLSLTRSLQNASIDHELQEEFFEAAGDLDRLMGELQVDVMRTRMQPLAKLFDRYPRVIRDIARQTSKKINLEISGKETEVDKTVLEMLADPLVHILRNSADHGVESIEDRLESKKSEVGTIRLEAEHQGSHVRVAIIDDGKGLDREVLGRKAVEKGLTTEEQLAQLSDEQVFRFILEAGFSTAKQVSDLSGRGVGMDVVRTNINKLNGTINIASAKGKGTTIEILIPLTVAIMPAMVVGVGQHLYSIPLQSIIEIVRPEEAEVKTINGQAVIRLRESVLPLVDMQKRLRETDVEDGGRFAVIVGVGGQKAGLVVDRLVGQQEIVIKPLNSEYTQGGPFSGATIQEDGQVSLILDIPQLIKRADQQTRQQPKAA